MTFFQGPRVLNEFFQHLLLLNTTNINYSNLKDRISILSATSKSVLDAFSVVHASVHRLLFSKCFIHGNHFLDLLQESSEIFFR
jgi:hypothetical protein